MPIRQLAAEKLVRQLLELRLTRVNKLSDRFISAMAKIVITHVEIDEQLARSEQLRPQPESKEPPMSTSLDGPPTAAACTDTKEQK